MKLVDFGLSCAPREASKRKPGTWAYWPPEAFERHEIGLGTDMWAIGVLGYILLSGYHPFDPYGDASDELMQRRICRNTYDFDDPAWRDVSDEARAVASPCNGPAMARVTLCNVHVCRACVEEPRVTAPRNGV